MYKPTIQRTPEAPRQAKKKLKELGNMTYAETTTLTVLIIALGFWIGGGYIKPTPISTMAVAFMALSLLLLTGALQWDDCLACTFAWDTLFWIAILMSQSKALTDKGVIAYFADGVSSNLVATGMPLVGIWMLLLTVYVAMHYLFASQSAHVAAMYPAFLAVMLRCGISPVLSAMSLAYIGNTMTAMTHYASAESVVYFSQRYYSVKAVWGVGFVMTLLNLAVWLSLGLGWWKAVGFSSDISTMT
jgi:DASS family divalent anion:Na+ symporter